MSNAEQVLVSHPEAPWLPQGGRADVVLAGGRAAAPTPTCLVRLVATRDGRVLVAPRPDGRGLDLPTLRVGTAGVEERVRDLLLEALGDVYPAVLLGYVRNVVPEPADDYPWPTPDAYFSVWHSRLPANADVGGVWLGAVDAEAQVGERHWWPLADHVSRSRAQRRPASPSSSDPPITTGAVHGTSYPRA